MGRAYFVCIEPFCIVPHNLMEPSGPVGVGADARLNWRRPKEVVGDGLALAVVEKRDNPVDP
jgi:hypothetical protein